MKQAEFLMAFLMAVFSLYIMWKSTELEIGWIPNQGPGGGAFPFWLGVGMLFCCILIIIGQIRKTDDPVESKKLYMDKKTFVLFTLVAGSLFITIGLISLIGVYVAIPLFMVFYLRFIGSHHWFLTGSIAAATPLLLFFFFEIALKITLPKGFTEPLFYPLYSIFL